MKRNKIFGIILVLISFLFITNVKAENGNEVTLNFEGGVIHDGYVEYKNVGKLQLFKDGNLVANISNDMKIELNSAEYYLKITELPWVGDSSTITGGIPGKVRLTINGHRYALPEDNFFKIDSIEFSGKLSIKLERTHTVVNTKVEKVYDNIESKGIIDFTTSKDYIIDFTKNDELTNGLKTFVDMNKILYYKNINGSLMTTDNENEAIIKIVGNKNENKAIMTLLKSNNKKQEQFKGTNTKYTGSKLTYVGTEDNNIINEIRTDYYTLCKYEFTFKYVNETEEKDIQKEIIYKFLEGENQKYIINESTNARFRIDADYSLFQSGGKVYIDDILVDTNNYTSESGSTIITLKKDYVSKLSVGEHKLKVMFNDGGVAESKFTISEVNNEVKEIVKNPQTGDSIATYIILSIISVVGIVVATIINKKKKEC